MGLVDPDGARLLTSRQVGDLLAAAVDHAGGRLVSWQLDHVDQTPGSSTTATYTARVDWPQGVRDELLGVSARAGGLRSSDGNAEIFADGDREVAVWLHPHDPDLPGLVRAAFPEQVAELLNQARLLPHPVAPTEVALRMVTYRPRRRAVVRVEAAGAVFYVKVLRANQFTDVVARHQLLRAGGIPAPEVLHTTEDHLVVLAELPGEPLATAMFEPTTPCTAEQLIGLLDALPTPVAQLERRPPWSDAVGHYAHLVSTALPSEAQRLEWMSREIEGALAQVPLGVEPTHGDFHEGQLHVAGGGIVGLLDVDTAGPGRRVDDLACLVAHLSTVQRMNSQQTERVHALIREWVPVFDTRVDPVELRLRAAAVVISLATGPYRSQEPDWRRSTVEIIDAAEALVRQVARR